MIADRQLADGVYWLPACHVQGDRHLHVSAYLLLGDEATLIDSGSPLHRDTMLEAIDRVSADLPVTSLVLTHPDLPHAGNLDGLRDRWGNIEVFAATKSPEITLGDAKNVTTVDIGSTISVGGRRVSFVGAPLRDVLSSAWIYDHSSSILFTADGFGHYHEPGDCRALSDELANGIDADDIRDFHHDLVPWLPYIDPDKLNHALDHLIDRLDIELVAPIHGNPIRSGDIVRYRAMLKESIVEIANEGNAYTGSFAYPAPDE